MKAFLVDPEKNITQVVSIEDDVQKWYGMLRCDIVEVARRRVGGYSFDFICDEEGMFKRDLRVSVVDEYGCAMIVGACLLLTEEEGSDGEVKFDGLSEDEIKVLHDHIGIVEVEMRDGRRRSNIAIVGVSY